MLICAGIKVVIYAESEIGKQCSNSSQACCIHLYTNTFEKGMNPSFIFSALNEIAE